MSDGESSYETHRVERAFAVVLLAVLAPVIGVVSVLIVLIDRRQPLIKLERVGRGFVPFGLIKFQTMTPARSGGRITAAVDARVSRLGRIIRSLRIDEIPQLINIVRGEMALVGPRPESPAFVDADAARWREVCSVRPGIGGTTQLFASKWEKLLLQGDDVETTYQEVLLPAKLDLDAWYVSNRSWRLDFRVIGATLSELFLHREAAELRSRILDEVHSVAVDRVRAAVADIEAAEGLPN